MKHKIVVICVHLMADDYVVMFKRTRKLLAFHRCFILKTKRFSSSATVAVGLLQNTTWWTNERGRKIVKSKIEKNKAKKKK